MNILVKYLTGLAIGCLWFIDKICSTTFTGKLRQDIIDVACSVLKM